MNLDSYLSELLQKLLSSNSQPTITAEQLIHSIDLTLLDEQASNTALTQLSENARHNQVAAICVYSKHLPVFQQLAPIQIATVINFPQGNEEPGASLISIEKASQAGATEIDYVFPYQLYLDGKKQEALERCAAVINLCNTLHLTSKIIIETGAFPEIQSIYEVSKSLIASGCNFLKTSTGKIAQGASLPAVFTILSAIKDTGTDCGLKVSGGIRTPEQAFHYAELAELMMGKKIAKTWFRIGASSLLNELLK